MAKRHNFQTPAQIAAEQRNQAIEAEKIKRAKRKNTLRNIITNITTLIDAWYFGTNGGGWAGEFHFPVIKEIPEKKLPSYSKRTLSIREALRDTIKELIPPTEHEDMFLKKCDYADKIMRFVELQTLKLLKDWNPYDALRLQTGVYAACLTDWLELEIREYDYIEEEMPVYLLTKRLAKFSEMTISQKDMRMRETMTAIYWIAWHHIFGTTDLSQHPNKLYRNLAVPRGCEVEDGLCDDGSTFSGKALFFTSQYAIPLIDYSASNAILYEKELKAIQPTLDKYDRSVKAKAIAIYKHQTSMSALPITGTRIGDINGKENKSLSLLW